MDIVHVHGETERSWQPCATVQVSFLLFCRPRERREETRITGWSGSVDLVVPKTLDVTAVLRCCHRNCLLTKRGDIGRLQTAVLELNCDTESLQVHCPADAVISRCAVCKEARKLRVLMFPFLPLYWPFTSGESNDKFTTSHQQ